MPAYITPLHGDNASRLVQNNNERKLSIFGSTGSIGASTLDVVRKHNAKNNHEHGNKIEIIALAGGSNATLLAKQALEFKPQYLAVKDEAAAVELKALLPASYKVQILSGTQGFIELASLPEANILLLAQAGAAGLNATIAGAKAGKILALANKESLVLAGSLIKKLCQEHGSIILPVDSEHNAIFQVSHAEAARSISQIWLTASGGPFYNFKAEQLAKISVSQALNHPKWSMGAKISIDSATMMNKGLEVIEAAHLFGLKAEEIKVFIHPESIVHSLVEFIDGSVLAQLGCPDMRIPISYCLAWPQRTNAEQPRLKLLEHPQLNFLAPNHELFPSLNLAYSALNSSQWHPIVLNAANEVAVDAFLNERISFLDIYEIVAKILNSNLTQGFANQSFSIENILALDEETRRQSKSLV